MSERKELAMRLSQKVANLKLDRPIGGYVGQSEDKGKPHVVLFAQPLNLDGCLVVYGPKFIQVEVVTRYSDFPHESKRVFESEENAVKFLELFAAHDFSAALEIPTK